jgi:chromosome segregation ATPase
MISDKEKSWNEILGKSANFKATEMSRDEYKSKWEKEVQARKEDYLKYQEELGTLKLEIETMKRQLENIDLRVDNKIEEGNKIEEKIPVESIVVKDNWFISLLKRIFNY